MSRIAEYFAKSFPGALALDKAMNVQTQDRAILAELRARIHVDFGAGARFVSLFMGEHENAAAIAETVLTSALPVLLAHQGVTNLGLPRLGLGFGGFQLKVENRLPESVVVHATHFDGTDVEAGALPFSGRVYLYTEREWDELTKTRLLSVTKPLGLSVIFRGPVFAAESDRHERPRAFVCHDSRDKAEIALPIALGLQKLFCPVWYDEFSMTVGQSLRESIEKGIKECGFCILVLTPQFLKNGGWPKREYTMAFTKELVEDRGVVLPVWHNVTRNDVFEYSPVLADRLAVQWALGVDEVCAQLYRAIDRASELST